MPETNQSGLTYADLRRFLLLVFALLLGAALVRVLAPILLLFTIVFFLAMILNGPVTALERRGIKRGLAVAAVMVALLVVLGTVLSLIVPLILKQGDDLAHKAPDYWTKIRAQSEALTASYPALDSAMPQLKDVKGTISPSLVLGNLLKVTRGVIGGLFLTILSLLLLVFTLVNPYPLVAGFLSAVPERHREAARRSIARTMQQMAAWIRATLINGTITGVLTGTLLYFIGVQPALLFGTLAFFGEFVPNIGPVVMSLPALFVALGIGPEKALWTLLAILLVQQISGNVLMPFVMGREMKLHPVSIVFFALAMGSLFGVAGAILSVPAAAIAKILFDEFYLRPQEVSISNIETQAAELVAGRALTAGEVDEIEVNTIRATVSEEAVS